MSRVNPPSPAEEQAWQGIVSAHLTRYPLLQVQDLYKLAYQAALGSEHLGKDRGQITCYLREELARIPASLTQPLYEEIAPQGVLVRVNLCPFKALGGDPAALGDALLDSMTAFQGSKTTLERYWQWLEAMAEAGLLPFPLSALQHWIERMRREGYPPVHHSPLYRTHYRPAYRVIHRGCLWRLSLPERRRIP
ncbi:MAG: hypothetical protein D6736_19485 [Nitrospinota bacterium]|nr:MAG: hypothetical protein D6736_19485 [Nitrospinota bacterium]